MTNKLKKIKFKTPKEYYNEAIRYYKNAKEKLKEAPVEYNRYQDLKPVREACGTCYLAVLLALDGYFFQRGVKQDKLPTSTKEVWDYLDKYLVHNGIIENAFQNAYEILHVWGYYRGAGNIHVVKAGFENAKIVIDTITKNKI